MRKPSFSNAHTRYAISCSTPTCLSAYSSAARAWRAACLPALATGWSSAQDSGGVSYRWQFTSKHTLRISLYISTGDKERNEQLYDQLYAWRTQLEPKLATLTVSWERLDSHQACRVTIEREGRITDPPETIAVLKEWATDKMILFHDVVQPFVDQFRAVEST